MSKKNILLGITGGIAAYKMVHVASNLTKMGYQIDVVMTSSAQQFVSPLTFRSITNRSVHTDLFSESNNNEVKHISLADNTDLVMIGPATANIIGKIANGIADDLLSTIIMAVRSPVIIVPAMNVNMYNNPIVQANIKKIKEYGYQVLKPAVGILACGYEGKGRLPEPDILTEYILMNLKEKDLKDKKILVTAGPTIEKIDPVRYLSNNSSGKMGYALAKQASYRGAKVKLIAGPTNLNPPLGVQFQEIVSARQLYQAVKDSFADYDLLIMTAAVADFTPKEFSNEKIKKNAEDHLILEMKKTNDIIKELASNKKSKQKIIGFAAESDNLFENAEKKLAEKNLDMVVANDIKNNEIFGSDFTEVTILTKDNKIELNRSSKEEIADKILNLV
ncbi:MAG: bifunctional phosphopantothenoylcysteine decarboxylase/phosphopantothenate--cysteine ligase CoaBC [Halanaerobiales bacterium]|nr:bifunctional phosphopantothenoylcysteine decarboxylase/phosphopantothenate--cysteine ligase CoaBC [Halanaerobiales bacterium]